MLRTHRPGVGVSVKEITALRCMECPTNQMSVFVFDDIRQKPFSLTPRSAVQLSCPIEHHKECRMILPSRVITWMELARLHC
jgi:hypothetical protein